MANRRPCYKPRRSLRAFAGFTLIEMMITVAIIAILAAVATPTYQQYMMRAYRADAQASLNLANAFMQRVRTEQGSFRPGGVVPTLPAPMQKSPSQGEVRYAIAVSNVTATTYTLSATPSSSISAREYCGALTIDHTGKKEFTGTASNATLKNCWNL
jgi:type IV pilus assembly protein PilE